MDLFNGFLLDFTSSGSSELGRTLQKNDDYDDDDDDDAADDDEVLLQRSYQGRNIWDDLIIEKSQDQDQDLSGTTICCCSALRCRTFFRPILSLVLALTLVLALAWNIFFLRFGFWS